MGGCSHHQMCYCEAGGEQLTFCRAWQRCRADKVLSNLLHQHRWHFGLRLQRTLCSASRSRAPALLRCVIWRHSTHERLLVLRCVLVAASLGDVALEDCDGTASDQENSERGHATSMLQDEVAKG